MAHCSGNGARHAGLTCISTPPKFFCNVDVMHNRAVEFVESWIDQHVTYSEKGDDSNRAATLADMCREAAATLGVTIEEIKPEFGTLETIILETLHYAVGTPED